MYSGTRDPLPGTASTPGTLVLPLRYPCSSTTSCGKVSAELGLRRSAYIVF